MAINRVRITSQGRSPWDMQITDVDTGELINCVSRVEIVFDVNLNIMVARLTIPSPLYDIVAPVEITKEGG